MGPCLDNEVNSRGSTGQEANNLYTNKTFNNRTLEMTELTNKYVN